MPGVICTILACIFHLHINRSTRLRVRCNYRIEEECSLCCLLRILNHDAIITRSTDTLCTANDERSTSLNDNLSVTTKYNTAYIQCLSIRNGQSLSIILIDFQLGKVHISSKRFSHRSCCFVQVLPINRGIFCSINNRLLTYRLGTSTNNHRRTAIGIFHISNMSLISLTLSFQELCQRFATDLHTFFRIFWVNFNGGTGNGNGCLSIVGCWFCNNNSTCITTRDGTTSNSYSIYFGTATFSCNGLFNSETCLCGNLGISRYRYFHITRIPITRVNNQCTTRTGNAIAACRRSICCSSRFDFSIIKSNCTR